MKPRIAAALGLGLFLGSLVAGVGTPCPPGSTAGIADIVATPHGPVVVESCVTESGGAVTFSYFITSGAMRPVELCDLVIPGLGTFTTSGTSAPSGMASAIDESSGCATWWSWKGAGVEILPGETVAFALSVDAPVTPTTRTAYLTFCDGTEASLDVLVPSACDDIGDGEFDGCICGLGLGPCEATGPYEGAGTRLSLLGPAYQELAVCDESWLRHGWGYGADIDSYLFALAIDGTPVELEQRLLCLPGETPGTGYLSSSWHVQFPAEFFEAGRLYEFVGTWIHRGETPGDIWKSERAVEVQAIFCLESITDPIPDLTPQIHLPSPDLAIRIVGESCISRWDDQQNYVREVNVTTRISNDGDADAGHFLVTLRSDVGNDTHTLMGLGPGAIRYLSFIVRLDSPVCPVEYTITVDEGDEVRESDEENDTVEGEECCD